MRASLKNEQTLLTLYIDHHYSHPIWQAANWSHIPLFFYVFKLFPSTLPITGTGCSQTIIVYFFYNFTLRGANPDERKGRWLSLTSKSLRFVKTCHASVYVSFRSAQSRLKKKASPKSNAP